MRNIAEIKEAIKKLNEELAEAERAQQTCPYSGDVAAIAEILHKNLCQSNHTDGCDWYYDRGNWVMWARKRYAEQAKRVATKFNVDTVQTFFKLINNA